MTNHYVPGDFIRSLIDHRIVGLVVGPVTGGTSARPIPAWEITLANGSTTAILDQDSALIALAEGSGPRCLVYPSDDGDDVLCGRPAVGLVQALGDTSLAQYYLPICQQCIDQAAAGGDLVTLAPLPKEAA